MKCSFCNLSLYSYLYNCGCDESVVSCRSCCQYGCYQCKAPLQRVQLKMCRKCREYKVPKYMFGDKYDVYCHPCCLKQYEACKGKKVILSTYTLEPDKYQLYCYLKKYCYTCNIPLSKDGFENQSPILKQIYPLQNNVCQKCIQNSIKSEISTQAKSSKAYGASENLTETSSQSKPSRYIPKDSRTQKPQKSNQKGKQEAGEKWKRVQQSPYIKCMACNRMIIGDGTVNEEVAICSTCTRGSNLEETLNSSRIKSSTYYENRVPRESNVDRTGIMDKGYNIIQNTKKQSNTRSESPKVYQYRESSKTPEKKSSANRQNSSNRVPVFPPKEYSSLKKSDSQTRLENVPVNVQLMNQSQLVECSKCGIRLEAVSAIWEENDDAPICRCCYTDLLQQLQRESKHKDRSEINTTKYGRYVEKKQEIPQNQKAQTNDKRQSDIKIKADKRTELRNNPIYGKTRQAEPQKDTQPIIKQEVKKEPLNKVKRTESWDDAILVEPVADHERRKKQKKLSEQQKNKINEQPQEYTQSQQQSQKKRNQKSEQKNNWDFSKASYQQNLGSHENDRLQKQESIEPTIVDDEQQRKKIQRSESWDQNIILEPLESINTKKTKSSMPDSNQKQPFIKKQQAGVQQSRNQKKMENDRMKYAKQQTQPIIVEQKKQKKCSVNRLTSWNEEIILEPVADHEQRKRQKLKQQQQSNTKHSSTTTTTANKNTVPATETKSNQRATHSEAKPKAETRPHTSNEYKRTNVPSQYDDMQKRYREATQKLRQTNASTSAYTTKQPYQSPHTSNHYTSKKAYEIPTNTTNSYYATSQPHTNSRQPDNYNGRQQFSRYFKQEENLNRSRQKKQEYFNRSPSFKQRLNQNFNAKSPYSSNFYRDDDFDKFFSDADQRFKTRLNQPPFFSQSRPSFYGMNSPHSNTNSNVRNDAFARETNESQRGIKKICGHCKRQFVLSSRSYRINNVPVCLDCYGEWNRKSKETQMPHSYFY